MNGQYLDFEKPVLDLEKRIQDMKDFASGESLELSREIQLLEKRKDRLLQDIYSKLTRWQRVQLARHPLRPHSLDYINLISTDFVELHGDRGFADDKAVVGGFGKIEGRAVMFVGQQKGRDTKQKLYRNFGMMHPEGYRKALRLMQIASRSGKPIIILVDTPGAFPGIGAEERGQAEAIARNLREMFRLKVPITINIIGEGASGGALGIGIGDRVLMLENSWYSVISPEGCSAILWRDSSKAPLAAEALRLSSFDLKELKVIDRIVPEPVGGAHRNPKEAADILKKEIIKDLNELSELEIEELLQKRIEKFRRMGVFSTEEYHLPERGEPPENI
ncbi:MAG: acetyl-CoA carboxylase carboxyltransferase subunit alpha [candidate division Zixibacteria bacterium RBG_16_43_9]|nr:MAG: acetyl-CoA carboxylase carboxyltransferase subunit alpha [candidate division Zixibacteria bacterium RBG_16_43_9]